MKEFICTKCSHIYPRRTFSCPNCKEFDSLVPYEKPKESSRHVATVPQGSASSLDNITLNDSTRIPTGISEVDRVLGGGFVDGEVLLFAGSPGSGKSTLSLSLAHNMANNDYRVLYSSGEESVEQIGLRARRMKISHKNIKVVHETSLETLLGYIETEKPDFLIVDSLQTLVSSSSTGAMGSINQSKEAAYILTQLAKERGIITLLINQVVKGGDDFAGSNQVSHIVDCTLMLESHKDSPLKFLRPLKNRFGSTTEVGVFQHSSTGLDEVPDPSSLFLDDDSLEMPGSSVGLTSEGIRQIPVEINSLVTDSYSNRPQRQYSGIPQQRGHILCAIVSEHCNVPLYSKDVFISTVAGLTIKDTQSDLAIVASVLSAYMKKSLPVDVVFIGEVHLTGKLRTDYTLPMKIKEAQRLGYKKIILPQSYTRFITEKHEGVDIVSVSTVSQLPRIISDISKKGDVK